MLQHMLGEESRDLACMDKIEDLMKQKKDIELEYQDQFLEWDKNQILLKSSEIQLEFWRSELEKQELDLKILDSKNEKVQEQVYDLERAII